MNTIAASRPLIESILYPSDFSEPSSIAFAHALKAALVARATLTMFHVAPKDEHARWSDFPGVRATLERWSLLAPGSGKSAVPQLGINVSKMVVQEDDPVKAILRYLDCHQVDLIVLATHQHEGGRTMVAQVGR